jgi:hypothetical protein
VAKAEIVMVWTPAATGVPINLQQDIGTATCFIRTKALDLDAVDYTKEIDQIVVHISDRITQVNLYLKIYSSDDEDGPFTLDDTLAIATLDPLNVDPPARRFFKFELRDLGVVDRWRLHGMEFWGRLAGREV